MQLYIETNKTILSSICSVYKTEKFLKQTGNFSDIDLFIDKIFGAILLNLNSIKALATNKDAVLQIEADNNKHTFYFVFSDNMQAVTFVKYSGLQQFVRSNDKSLSEILRSDQFSVSVNLSSIQINKIDLIKQYRLSNSPKITFPLLNEKQKSVVAIEDENVLVQGVAGSGKTNLCVDKIIFAACRSYRGKILYTTYSRGLLIDTQTKVKLIENNLKAFADSYKNNNVIFVDSKHKKAIENKLGIYFAEDDNKSIIDKINSIIKILSTNIDYMLLEDIYTVNGGSDNIISGENWFTKIFINELKNHQLLNKLRQTSNLSYEVIYKEIYGVIMGCYNENDEYMLPLNEYIEKRSDSFNKSECEIIYWLAKDYLSYLTKTNSVDNNLICRQLLAKINQLSKYTLTIIDEAQDMTQLNLFFFKCISTKMFCVGDALQMINPSYFSFAYLKRLMYEKDISTVAQLNSNYRSTKAIAALIEKLGLLNIKLFGTHSFILNTTGVESDTPTGLVYLNDSNFIRQLESNIFNNYTIIVASAEQKEKLRKTLKKQEILTVSEIKGLERNVVILYNVLSSNAIKFEQLSRITINRKKSDENSVYRYYFNLFYVGVSRGKSHIFVVEDQKVEFFNELFSDNFDNLTTPKAMAVLTSTSDKTEAEQDQLLQRIDEFIKLGQYDNARFAANSIINEKEKIREINKISIYETYVSKADYRSAGIALWEAGMPDEAKTQFVISKDEQLIKLIDACLSTNSDQLNIDIVEFLPEVMSNKTAYDFIIGVINKDYNNLTANNKEIKAKLSKINSSVKRN